jgi:hypothetical protein
MALYAAGSGASQFFRGLILQARARQTLVAERSRDLSDAMTTLRAPQMRMASVRTSSATQMATLCLVQSSDTQDASGSVSGGMLGGVLAAYATVLAD